MKEIKKEIRERIYLSVDESILSGSLQQVAANILQIEGRLNVEGFVTIARNKKEKFKVIQKNFIDWIRYEISVVSDYDSSYPSIELYGVRMESDAEFSTRIERNRVAAYVQKKADEKKKENDEKKELATYLRLKKKFAHILKDGNKTNDITKNRLNK